MNANYIIAGLLELSGRIDQFQDTPVCQSRIRICVKDTLLYEELAYPWPISDTRMHITTKSAKFLPFACARRVIFLTSLQTS